MIIEDLRKLDINNGDILWVSSDLSKILIQARREGIIKDRSDVKVIYDRVIDGLKDLVGEEGTLVFPAFSADFCNEGVFDHRNTKSDTGVLDNYILMERDDFIRTRHPVHSFSVWGKHSALLSNMDNQGGMGKDSPLAFLYQNEAKQLFIDIDYTRALSFLHFVEEEKGVTYRYQKYF